MERPPNYPNRQRTEPAVIHHDKRVGFEILDDVGPIGALSVAGLAERDAGKPYARIRKGESWTAELLDHRSSARLPSNAPARLRSAGPRLTPLDRHRIIRFVHVA